MSAATSPFRQRCNFIIDLARRLHACGMSTDRLEGAVLTVSKRLGVRTEIWCNPTGIILSFSSPQKSDGAEITRVLRLAPGDINLKALAMVDDIAERVTDGRMEVDEGLQALTALDRPMGREKLAITVLAFGLASGSVAALLRTSWADVAASAVIGLMIGLLCVASSSRPRLHEASDAIAALLATLTASAIAAFLTPLSLQTVVIASLIVLMPGLMLTTAVAELSSQNWASGTARFAGATVALLKLTFGTIVATQAAHALGWQPQLISSPQLPAWAEWVGLLVGSAAFAVLFGAARRDFLIVMAGAWIGYGLTRLGGQIPGLSSEAFAGGVFLAGLGVAMVSNAFGRIFRRPGALLRVSGIILLVPGSVGFRSLNFVMERDVVLGLDTAVAVLSALIALVAGLLFGNLLVPPRRYL
ncbi:threonine/serine exporter family protein [Silanimonas sp.]|uniref:threonine/serine ThrE exporter family protein n=1 Tax=Silanimonas sp. TaxID=1929290 RepID=UPI0022C76D73|nr:threonine/serine exporter family protein [Silanimonas sp.]MCZ8165257.1 threonine/serine exporter family protein [Silanimonas sp.]